MRILLIILLFLSAIATLASTMMILSIPTAPLALKIVPLVYAAAAIISAVMLIRRSAKAVAPYSIGFVLFLTANIFEDGFSTVPKAALGFVIIALFFIPSVRGSSPKAPTNEAGNA